MLYKIMKKMKMYNTADYICIVTNSKFSMQWCLVPVYYVHVRVLYALVDFQVSNDTSVIGAELIFTHVPHLH